MFSVLLRRRPGEFSGVGAGPMAATRAPGFAALAIAAGSDGGDPRARFRRACDRRGPDGGDPRARLRRACDRR